MVVQAGCCRLMGCLPLLCCQRLTLSRYFYAADRLAETKKRDKDVKEYYKLLREQAKDKKEQARCLCGVLWMIYELQGPPMTCCSVENCCRGLRDSLTQQSISS